MFLHRIRGRDLQRSRQRRQSPGVVLQELDETVVGFVRTTNPAHDERKAAQWYSAVVRTGSGVSSHTQGDRPLHPTGGCRHSGLHSHARGLHQRSRDPNRSRGRPTAWQGEMTRRLPKLATLPTRKSCRFLGLLCELSELGHELHILLEVVMNAELSFSRSLRLLLFWPDHPKTVNAAKTVNEQCLRVSLVKTLYGK